MDLFGVGSFEYMLVENPIEILTGNPGTPYEGMEFTESGQHINWYIDNLTALPGAYCTFYENDYGNVGIENSGSYGQKTSYFGYALAELKDVDAESSRYNILLQVMKFFGHQPEPGYVIANFTSDARTGGPGVEVQFQDLSLTGEGYTVNEWHWDFENDGIIDSQEQNPVYVFQEAGTFDVRLVASNGTVSDTLIYPGFIHINSGIFVFEGFSGERNLSGTYIRDFLEENSLDVTYSGELFPETLDGFDAVFLSLGNYLGGYTPFNNDMAGIVLDYLQGGGQVYLEGGDALGFDQATNQALFDLFGLEGVEDGTTNSIDMLQGQAGSLVEGLSFSGSNQTVSAYIDIYIPGAGTAAFEESGYGIVGVQNEAAGPGLPYKTFCFSYALAELQDGEMPNTREELMWRLLDFFGLITGVEEKENASDEIEMQVWPNPLKGEAMVSFYNQDSLNEASLQICDLAGRSVTSIALANLAGGRNQVSVKIPELSAGIYVVKLEIGGKTAGRKVVIK
jgi:PKD repeat protein